MSGHSKWHSIKHKKAAVDQKRGKIFTRIIKEITVAARFGSGNPDSNTRLKHAIDEAKAANVPGDNIKKAILRGTGELEGVNYEELIYEGYGPGGVAIIVETATDNKNRTVSEIRHAFDKYHGRLGEKGCVGWMFSKKGLIIILKETIAEDELMEIIIEAGAEDLRLEDENYEILTEPADFDNVLKAIKEKGIDPEFAKLSMVPANYITLKGDESKQMLTLLEKLEELDDTQNVWTNCDFSTEE